jgi:hypothetical protein
MIWRSRFALPTVIEILDVSGKNSRLSGVDRRPRALKRRKRSRDHRSRFNEVTHGSAPVPKNKDSVVKIVAEVSEETVASNAIPPLEAAEVKCGTPVAEALSPVIRTKNRDSLDFTCSRTRTADRVDKSQEIDVRLGVRVGGLEHTHKITGGKPIADEHNDRIGIVVAYRLKNGTKVL